MKQGSNQRRSRGRSGGGGGGRRNNRNQTFDSNGPDVKVRGTAQQVLDKYLQLARDAQSGGDRVKAEAYLQFAEHYFRIVNADKDAQDSAGRRGEQSEQQSAQSTPSGQGNQDAQGGQDAQGAQEPQAAQGESKGEKKPARGRRRNAPTKNAATLAAEAAAANEAKNAKADDDDAPADEAAVNA